MLVLSRRADEEIVITVGDVQVRVSVVAIRGDKVRLGFTAPSDVTINRAEIQARIDHEGSIHRGK